MLSGFLLLSGFFCVAVAVLILASADRLKTMLRKVFHTHWLFGFSLLLLMIGAALLAQGTAVAYSLRAELTGWLVVLVALTLVVIPVRSLRVMADSLGAAGNVPRRLCGLGGLIFGLLLMVVGVQ